MIYKIVDGTIAAILGTLVYFLSINVIGAILTIGFISELLNNPGQNLQAAPIAIEPIMNIVMLISLIPAIITFLYNYHTRQDQRPNNQTNYQNHSTNQKKWHLPKIDTKIIVGAIIAIGIIILLTTPTQPIETPPLQENTIHVIETPTPPVNNYTGPTWKEKCQYPEEKIIGEEFALFTKEGNKLKKPIFETTEKWGENAKIMNTNETDLEIILKAKVQVGCNNNDTRYSLKFREYPLTLPKLSSQEIKLNTNLSACNIGGIVGELFTGEHEIEYLETQENIIKVIPITETICKGKNDGEQCTTNFECGSNKCTQNACTEK